MRLCLIVVFVFVGATYGQFASGPVSNTCLQCICNVESGCRNLPCHWDVNSDSCGYFQIKEVYFQDCNIKGKSWKECAADKHCASECIQNYIRRYATHFNCPNSCESYARMHNGGPNGCHNHNTLGYWNRIKAQPGCTHLH